MGKSYSKVWIHSVWATKNRIPLILPSFERQLHTFIASELRKMNCYVEAVNGMPDHVHCLFLLNPEKSLTDVMKQLKGSSSYFINSQNLMQEKFSWQRGYGAFSVSESGKNQVCDYIKNQKKRHKARTFEEEYIQFLRLHNFESIELG